MKTFTKTDIRDKIYEILLEYFGSTEIQKVISKEELCNIDLSKIDIDSLTYVELFMELENYFEIKISDDEIYDFLRTVNANTINDIAKFVWDKHYYKIN